MVTPLLAPLRTDGGTLYTFSSASRDLTRIFTDNRYSFSFSHFACLNLPDIKNTDISDKIGNLDTPYERGMYLENLLNPDDFKDEKEHSTEVTDMFTTEGLNVALAEHLQNYVMNFETAIWNGMGDNDDYDTSQLRSVAERVFFNWLINIGAIDFKTENEVERIYEANSYVEGWNYNGTLETAKYKDRVVKYIGKIDVLNSVDVAGDAYDEVYIHIPGSVGGSNVKFFSVYDKNYDITKEEYQIGEEYIIGRENLDDDNDKNGEGHPYGLSLKALYDNTENQSYKTRAGATTGGFCIDFRDDSYNGGIDYMNSMSQDDFEFNCVLLYYTLTDNNTGDAVTNLYGVLFLEEVTAINTDDSSNSNKDKIISKGYIQRYPKIAGVKTQNEDGTYSISNGNSYALKVDLKVDTLPDTTMTSKTYTDPNNDYAGALEIYSQSLMQLQLLVSKVLEEKKTLNELISRISYLEGNLSLINDIPTIKSNIEDIQNTINYSDVIYNGQSLLELISYNSNQIDSLIQGKTSAKLTVDASAISGGYGIGITTDDNGNITLNNTIGTYNVSYFYGDAALSDDKKYTNDGRLSLYNANCNDIDVYTDISEGNNIALLYVSVSDKSKLQSDLIIHVNPYDWKTGQSLRIRIMTETGTSFTASPTKGNTTAIPAIKIYCDDADGNAMCITEKDDLMAYQYNGLYEIEIICIDSTASEATKKFIYDMKVR